MPSRFSSTHGSAAAWARAIDRCLEGFQAALHRGERPALEDFLPADSTAALVLVELVHIEVEFRLKHGEAVRIEEYLARYPRLAGDPAAVADLLDAECAFRRRRAWAADALPTTPLPADFSPNTLDRPCVPGYETLAELGRGAMGIVYKARQIALNRSVALKMLHVSWRSDAEQRKRFRTEVETIALLQHPNIVPIHDFGEHEGRPFFTMEYLEGGSLADHYRGRPQPPKAAAELVETLARAMHAVHVKGIVHRDLKPSNVLRTAEGCPKIIDFGLARRPASDLTAPGDMLGTPSYMAPEQAAGKTSEVGPAADVYALGAILYELLTGRPPFRGLTIVDVVRQVQDSDPLPPRRLVARTPIDVETICLKCLHKEPRRRFASALELADDLRRFRDGESIRARRPAWTERAVRWMRRRPAAAVVFAAVVLAAVAVPLALLGHTLRLEEALQREEDERDRARIAEDQARRHEVEARIAHFAADLKRASKLFNRGDVFRMPDLQEPLPRAHDAADDPCGFDWRYLRKRSQKARPALAAHDGPLHLLTYSPDGRELVTGGGGPEKQSLNVWDLQKGRTRLRQPLHGIFLGFHGTRAAYSDRGALLAGVVAGREGMEQQQMVLWDFASDQVRFRVHSGHVDEIALSPNGRWLAASNSARIAIWNCATGRQQCTIPALGDARLTFDAAGDTLVASGKNDSFRGLQWWHAPTGTLRKQVPTPMVVDSLSFSPGGAFLLLIGTDGKGVVWEASQGIPLHCSHRIGSARSLAMSAADKTLAAGDDEGVVRLWDVPAFRLRARYRWQAAAIVQLAFSPDNRTLAAATAEGQVHRLDAAIRHTPDNLQTVSMRNGPLVWSPDGETVAAAGDGGTVQLFDRRTARTRRMLACPFQNVRCLAFSPDGVTLATSCEDERFVRLWNAKDGRQRAATLPQTKDIAALAFHPDGRRLATADDKTVRFWDAASGTACGALSTDRSIQVLAFTADGRTLLTAGSNIQVWDIGGGLSPAKPASSAPSGSTVLRLAVSRDGRHVATSELNGPVRLWRLSADRQLTPQGQAPVSVSNGRGLDFTPDGKTLFVCHSSWLDGCSLWDFTDRFCRMNYYSTRGSVNAAALSPDGRNIAGVGGEGAMRLWDTTDWQSHRPAGQALGRVRSLTFSADGRDLITAHRPFAGLVMSQRWIARFETAPLYSTAQSLRFWDAATGREHPARVAARSTMTPPYVVARSPDGRLLAAGAEDGSVQVWDRSEKQGRTRLFVSEKAGVYATKCELARRLVPATNPNYWKKTEGVAALAFSPDGRRLATAGDRGSIRVWETAGWKECGHWQGDVSGSPWLAFTLDGERVAGSRCGQVCVWNARSGQRQTALGDETDSPVLCGVFAPGKDVLALGSKDGLIRLWNLSDGRVKRLPAGHSDRVTSLAFAPDGKTLASSSWDRTVRLWNMRAGRETVALEGHQGRVNAVAFSPDGKTLASGAEVGEFLGEVLLWR